MAEQIDKIISTFEGDPQRMAAEIKSLSDELSAVTEKRDWYEWQMQIWRDKFEELNRDHVEALANISMYGQEIYRLQSALREARQ